MPDNGVPEELLDSMAINSDPTIVQIDQNMQTGYTQTLSTMFDDINDEEFEYMSRPEVATGIFFSLLVFFGPPSLPPLFF